MKGWYVQGHFNMTWHERIPRPYCGVHEHDHAARREREGELFEGEFVCEEVSFARRRRSYLPWVRVRCCSLQWQWSVKSWGHRFLWLRWTPPRRSSGHSSLIASRLLSFHRHFGIVALLHLICSCISRLTSVFGEDALVHVAVDKNDGTAGKLVCYVRIRSKTQGIALSLGDGIIKCLEDEEINRLLGTCLFLQLQCTQIAWQL